MAVRGSPLNPLIGPVPNALLKETYAGPPVHLNSLYMSEAERLIQMILKAARPEEIAVAADWPSEYKRIMRIIHPDTCSLSMASAAATRLNELKQVVEKGVAYSDESGVFYSDGYKAVYEGDAALLKKSFDNYRRLRASAGAHLLKYLPRDLQWERGRLTVHFAHRAVPLSGQQLPQAHVNWVLSRLLELAALVGEAGYVHGGLNPESVFVVPETHGIQVATFYHLAPAGTRVSTLSGRYKNWYPPVLFEDKLARPATDLELSKKIAMALLGDPSGSGVKLKKRGHAAFLDFVIRQDEEPYIAYRQYRELLSRHFEKKFHILHL